MTSKSHKKRDKQQVCYLKPICKLKEHRQEEALHILWPEPVLKAHMGVKLEVLKRIVNNNISYGSFVDIFL